MTGINRAEIKDEYIFAEYKRQNKDCIFISHKKEDEHVAIALGNYIMDVLGKDIYLDIYDCDLSEAVSVENDVAIVQSIQNGISCSTHLVCIISDKTKVSWWVPYEIGYAETNLKSLNGDLIASAKVTNISDIPSFLKVKRTLSSTRELVNFLKISSRYGRILSNHIEDGTEITASTYSRRAYNKLLYYFG